MSKFTYTKNRVIIPLLLLSILSLSSATIYYGSNPPYLASSVTLPKNFKHPPTVTDTDHQASDYWWDGTLPPKRDQQQKILLPNAIVTFPLVPTTPPPTTNNKSIVFSTATKDLEPPLSPNSTPPSSTQNQHSLRPYRVFSPSPGSNSEIFISPRFTTHFNLYCTHRHYETDNHLQLFNKFASQFLIMFQCSVFHLLTPNSFAMTLLRWSSRRNSTLITRNLISLSLNGPTLSTTSLSRQSESTSLVFPLILEILYFTTPPPPSFLTHLILLPPSLSYLFDTLLKSPPFFIHHQPPLLLNHKSRPPKHHRRFKVVSIAKGPSILLIQRE